MYFLCMYILPIVWKVKFNPRSCNHGWVQVFDFGQTPHLLEPESTLCNLCIFINPVKIKGLGVYIQVMPVLCTCLWCTLFLNGGISDRLAILYWEEGINLTHCCVYTLVILCVSLDASNLYRQHGKWCKLGLNRVLSHYHLWIRIILFLCSFGRFYETEV